MNATKELGTESVGRLLLKFSIPAIIGMLVNVLYSIVDRIFVGRGVGSLPLSGVAVTFPITNVIMAFGMLAGIGAGAVISIKLGQNKKEEAEHILGNAFVLLVIFSIFITVLGVLFLEPILKILGANEDIMLYAKEFSFIIFLGVIFQNIAFGLNSVIRSQGDPKTAMITMLLGAFINFIANPLFIFVFKMGVRGSALSTVISQIITATWTLSFFLRGKGLLKLKRENLRLDSHIIKQIMSIGMSPFVMQLAASVVTIAFNKSLENYGGSIAIGAMALVTSINMLILMPIFGINQGVQPIIGYNYGAKNYKRVKKALKYAVMGATAITVFGFIMVELFPVQIIKIFNSDDVGLVDMGSRGLTIFLLMLPIVGFTIVGTTYFQAIAKAKLSMILSLLRQVVFLIPLILILPNYFKLDGIWMAQPIADFITTVITGVFVYREMKILTKSEQKDKEEEFSKDDLEVRVVDM